MARPLSHQALCETGGTSHLSGILKQFEEPPVMTFLRPPAILRRWSHARSGQNWVPNFNKMFKEILILQYSKSTGAYIQIIWANIVPLPLCNLIKLNAHQWHYLFHNRTEVQLKCFSINQMNPWLLVQNNDPVIFLSHYIKAARWQNDRLR